MQQLSPENPSNPQQTERTLAEVRSGNVGQMSKQKARIKLTIPGGKQMKLDLVGFSPEFVFGLTSSVLVALLNKGDESCRLRAVATDRAVVDAISRASAMARSYAWLQACRRCPRPPTSSNPDSKGTVESFFQRKKTQ